MQFTPIRNLDMKIKQPPESCCFSVVRPKGIEPLPQAPEAYVLSIGPRAHDFDATNEVYRDDGDNATKGEMD